MYKKYNSCLISFLSFFELFPAFNWAKEIGNLLSIWLGDNIFKRPLSCFCLSSLKRRTSSTILFIFCNDSICFTSFLQVLLSISIKLSKLLLIVYTIRLVPVEYSNGNIQNIWNIQKF